MALNAYIVWVNLYIALVLEWWRLHCFLVGTGLGLPHKYLLWQSRNILLNVLIKMLIHDIFLRITLKCFVVFLKKSVFSKTAAYNDIVYLCSVRCIYEYMCVVEVIGHNISIYCKTSLYRIYYNYLYIYAYFVQIKIIIKRKLDLFWN